MQLPWNICNAKLRPHRRKTLISKHNREIPADRHAFISRMWTATMVVQEALLHVFFFPYKTTKKEWFVMRLGAQGESHRFPLPACPFQDRFRDLLLLCMVFRTSHGNV